ncbi:MAG: stage III sporulation protein AF [Blautia sp.]
MAESIYGWMQDIACYFIFLSAVMHFLPDNSYKKYIQYYMGLLLILLLLSPVLQILNLETKIQEEFDKFYQQEESSARQWQEQAEQIESQYWQLPAPEERMGEP